MHPLFYAVFEPLPRQGPGSRACARRALAMCTDLPAQPDVVDLGAGAGAQTLYVAELTGGRVTAIEAYAPLVERIAQRARDRGLADRIDAVVGDMNDPPVDGASFDLVWAEGALYNIGIPRALEVCRTLLRPQGYVAFTEAVWRTPDPPAEARALFEDYPAMGYVDDVLTHLDTAGFDVCGQFVLPDEAWWDDFYGPMLARIDELRAEHGDDPDALAVLDEIATEPAAHRRLGEHYGYAFFVARMR